MSIRLYVGNLPKELERQELEAVFSDIEGVISTKVITDRRTGKCRGFGFVTVKTDEQADQVIEKFNGFMLKDSELKIEKALPRSKSKSEEGASDEPAPATPAPNTSGSSSNRRKKSPKRSGSSPDIDSVQPDPRWADDLAKLKKLLEAQPANS